MLTLDEMVAKGTRKLTAKAATMASGWSAAKTRMKSGYGATPFSARIHSAYNTGVDAGIYHAPDPTKWATNWRAKMTE